MYTSKYICQHRGVDNGQKSHIGGIQKNSLIEDLKKEGYALGLAGKNHTFNEEYIEKWFDYRQEYGHWGKTHGDISEMDKEIIKFRQSNGQNDEKLGNMMPEGYIESPEPFDKEHCMTNRIAEDAIAFIEQNTGCEQAKPFSLLFVS